jgi:hypothetical protein
MVCALRDDSCQSTKQRESRANSLAQRTQARHDEDPCAILGIVRGGGNEPVKRIQGCAIPCHIGQIRRYG